MRTKQITAVRGFLLLAVVCTARMVHACPGCPPTQPTIVEELETLDVAVLAVQVGERAADTQKLIPDLKEYGTFRITKILKGAKQLGKTREATILYFGNEPAGTVFYLTANDSAGLKWHTPMALSKRGVSYLETVVGLPKDRAARLAVLQEYLEDSDSTIATDAYNEFTTSPYEALVSLRDKMDRAKLRRWVQDRNVSPTHRKLYLTMLGICGNADDAKMLGKLLESDESDGTLDSLVASFLVLHGTSGLKVVEDRFLNDPKAAYVDTFAAVQGLRILEQLSDRIPRERLAKSLRLVLDRAEIADVVIPDLARWKDWQSMDRLVKLFHDAPPAAREATRVAVLRYLLVCPLPAAKTHREKLAQIDPKAMRQATTVLPIRSAPAAPPAEE